MGGGGEGKGRGILGCDGNLGWGVKGERWVINTQWQYIVLIKGIHVLVTLSLIWGRKGGDCTI